jgi:hypothetical protein
VSIKICQFGNPSRFGGTTRRLSKQETRFEATPRILEMDDYGGFAPPLPLLSSNFPLRSFVTEYEKERARADSI